jgi:hypothetical protein
LCWKESCSKSDSRKGRELEIWGQCEGSRESSFERQRVWVEAEGEESSSRKCVAEDKIVIFKFNYVKGKDVNFD